MSLPVWFNLEAERNDLSYRTGIKLTPDQLRLKLLREDAEARYPSIVRKTWTFERSK